MMLYEEGALQLTNPVSRCIPDFNEMRVSPGAPTRARSPCRTEPMRSGTVHPHVRADLRIPPGPPGGRHLPGGGLRSRRGRGHGLAAACDSSAALPLLFEPGTEWNLRRRRRVLGGVVEVASGQWLEEYFAERIFGPLGMTDAGFSARGDGVGGAPPCMPAAPAGRFKMRAPMGRGPDQPPRCSAAATSSSRPRPTIAGSCRCCSRGRTARPASSTDPPAQPAHGPLHGPQPPARQERHRDLRPRAERQVAAARRRLRLGFAVVVNGPRSRSTPRRASCPRRRGLHRLLDRPDRGARGVGLHPAYPVQRPAGAAAAAEARLPILR